MHANTTSLAQITAGEDELGFTVIVQRNRRANCEPYSIWHPGPLSIYLSRAPTGDVREYDGSGQWFKIYELGLNMSIPANQTQQWLPLYNNEVMWDHGPHRDGADKQIDQIQNSENHAPRTVSFENRTYLSSNYP